jgi:hypothetical protein
LALLALALALAVPALSSGQFTSGVNLVEVYASVTDARGEPLLNLRR